MSEIHIDFQKKYGVIGDSGAENWGHNSPICGTGEQKYEETIKTRSRSFILAFMHRHMNHACELEPMLMLHTLGPKGVFINTLVGGRGAGQLKIFVVKLF